METRSANGIAPGASGELHNSEVVDRPRRRRFPLDEKRRILAAADACAPGTLGALLRREGIYSSLLAAWRVQRDRGELDVNALRKRAATKRDESELKRRNAELERENRKLHRKLQRAELIMDIQKKAAGLLGIELGSPENNDFD